MTYCDRIRRTAPSIDKETALSCLEDWQAEVQRSDEPLLKAAENTPLSPRQTEAIHALYAEHARQIDKLCRRLHEREVASNGRSVLTLEDLQAESFRLFRALLAAYDPGRAALSTYLQVSMRTRLMNVLRDSRKRETGLDDALKEGETEPADESYQAPLPHDLDLSEVADQIIEDRPPKEHARLREVWDRLRNPV